MGTVDYVRTGVFQVVYQHTPLHTHVEIASVTPEKSSWLAAVDGEEVKNGDSAVSPVGGRFITACAASGGVLFLLEGVVLPSTGFEVRGFLDGVNEDARPSQRDRFEVGVVVGVGIAGPEFGLGK